MADSRRIIWAEVALGDFEEILEYVATHGDAAAADGLGTKILRAIEGLDINPERCRIVPELRHVGVRDYRELIVSRYRVFFRITGRAVEVLRIFDGRRDLTAVLLDRLLAEVDRGC